MSQFKGNKKTKLIEKIYFIKHKEDTMTSNYSYKKSCDILFKNI